MILEKPEFFVGSLPFQSVTDAILFVKKNSSHLPFLPQLPELNPQEDMIGQVLRGFELGFWDEKASVALEAFQNEFGESPRVKIQIAGPATVSRMLSLTKEKIIPQWEKLVIGIIEQLRQGHFIGEIWLQIDEPLPKGTALLLEGQNASPKVMPYLLGERLSEAVRKIRAGRQRVVFGVHSCATERPQLSPELLQELRFLSFDCERTPVTTQEKEAWSAWLKEDPQRVFACGISAEKRPQMDPLLASWIIKEKQVWLSAPCGLYGQSLY